MRGILTRLLRWPARLALPVSVLAFGLAGAAPAGASDCDSANEVCQQFEKGLQKLVTSQLLAIPKGYAIEADEEDPLQPGTRLEAQVIDRDDPLSDPRADRDIDLGKGDAHAFAPVDVSIKWSAHSSRATTGSGRQPLPSSLVNVTNPTAQVASFVFAPGLAELGAGAAARRFLRVTVKLSADPPSVRRLVQLAGGNIQNLPVGVDLSGISSTERADIDTIDLERSQATKEVPITLPTPALALPLELPSVLLLCGNKNCKPGDDEGFVLVVLPEVTPLPDDTLTSLQNTLSSLRQKVRTVASVFTFFAGMAADIDAVTTVLGPAGGFEEGTNLRLMLRNKIKNLNDITMIQRGIFSNDTEAEDTITAVMNFGLRPWDLFVARDLKRGEGSMLFLGPDPGASLTDQVRNLLNFVPTLRAKTPGCSPTPCPGTRVSSKKTISNWSNEFSSLRVEQPALSGD